MEICPVCGKKTYKEWPGVYEDFKKISPDIGECSSCGFYYEEHIKHALEEQANKYKNKEVK